MRNKKSFDVWGSGKPFRELIYVDDVADACVFYEKKIKDTLINIGTGKDYTISYYAKFIKKKLKLSTKINFDKTKPDGVKEKF